MIHATLRKLCYISIAVTSLVVACAATACANDVPNSEIEELVKRQVVMISASIQDELRIGGGIIVGSDHDRFYIATANHVVRRGDSAPDAVEVQCRGEPTTGRRAELLGAFDRTRDLAVITVEKSHDCDMESTTAAYGWIGSPKPLTRLSRVSSISFRHGRPWATTIAPDIVSQKESDRIYVESSFAGPGLSGGALLNEYNEIIGMIINDSPPEIHARYNT